MINLGKISAYYAMPHPPIIVPEVGRGEEEKIKETSLACSKVAEEILNIKPDTIIIVTPHGPMFRDAIALMSGTRINGSLARFRAPQVALDIEINEFLTEKIIEAAHKEKIITAQITKDSAKTYGIEFQLDHGALIPLYFINKMYTNYQIVHITYGMLSKLQLYKFGNCIKRVIEESDTNTVLIASGDLSHRLTSDGPYEYSPYGEKFDKEIISLLEKGDVKGIFNMDHTTIEEAGECGLRSYYIMLGAMNGYEINGDLLAYEGTFGVGYSVMKFNLKESSVDIYDKLVQESKEIYKKRIENEDTYVKLARESLTHYLTYGDYLEIPSYVTDEMKKYKRGVFVSIKKEGQLRGCIGTILPTTESIAKEIIRNAVEAGENDPRFSPIREEELGSLTISVDVLTEPVKALKDELDPKRYGVIVRSGFKSGLLLPDLEGVDTVEHQLQIALQKANIDFDDDYTVEKFEVIRHR